MDLQLVRLAYAIFEIPTAKWAETLGTKAVLTRIVLWWSAFTAATAVPFRAGFHASSAPRYKASSSPEHTWLAA